MKIRVQVNNSVFRHLFIPFIFANTDYLHTTILHFFVADNENIWGLMGFRAAHCKALEDRESRVIIIKKGDTGKIKSFQSDLKAYLRTNVFLRWEDNQFFDKLSTAIAHPEYFKTKYLVEEV